MLSSFNFPLPSRTILYLPETRASVGLHTRMSCSSSHIPWFVRRHCHGQQIPCWFQPVVIASGNPVPPPRSPSHTSSSLPYPHAWLSTIFGLIPCTNFDYLYHDKPSTLPLDMEIVIRVDDNIQTVVALLKHFTPLGDPTSHPQHQYFITRVQKNSFYGFFHCRLLYSFTFNGCVGRTAWH